MNILSTKVNTRGGGVFNVTQLPKRQRAAALQNLADFPRIFKFAAASWSAAVLCRFPRHQLAVKLSPLVEPQQTVLPWWGERWHVPAFMLFVTSWVVCVIAQIIKTLAPDWMTGLVLLSALISSLVTLGRQQPLQNIIITGVIFLVAGAGWVQFSDSTDSPLDYHRGNWRAVVIWAVILLNARGAGQFLLRLRRRSRFYGWELIGVSALVFTWAAVLLRDLLYRPIAVLLLVSFFGTAALLVISLPLFMNKRPVEPPVSWQPIVVLLLLLLWAYLPRI